MTEINYPIDKDLKESLKMILTDYPDLRDDDRRLISNVWWWEAIKKYETHGSIDFKRFLVDFSKGAFTNPETIRRTRQKIQEEYRFLRGKRYEERQKSGQEVQASINYK